MTESIKPLLSIGMIFKNEERCLERCLESLEPLRKALPCQLVLADTGSTDRSHEIAEKYADVLFDFPWIDDFSAAKNAVLDRCEADWRMIIDADEWLDQDFSGLTDFLTGPQRNQFNVAQICIRNYVIDDSLTHFEDFHALRLARKEARFAGIIHEAFVMPEGRKAKIVLLENVRLLHDGYIPSVSAGKNKRERNITLLREELERNPNDIRCYMLCAESAETLTQKMEFTRRGLEILDKPDTLSPMMGASLYRHGIHAAAALKDLDQMEKWLGEAEARYPRSIYINVDAEGSALLGWYEAEEYEKAARCGERWEKGVAYHDVGPENRVELSWGTLVFISEEMRTVLRLMLFSSYYKLREWEKAGAALDRIELSCTSLPNWDSLVRDLFSDDCRLPRSERHLRRLWKTAAAGAAENAELWQPRKDALLREMALLFRPGRVNPLRAAAASWAIPELRLEVRLLLEEDPDAFSGALEGIVSWPEPFSTALCAHAMALGVSLPACFYARPCERLAADAAALFEDGWLTTPALLQWAGSGEEGQTIQELLWRFDAAASAACLEQWEDAGAGRALAGLFETLARRYLHALYQPEVLDGKAAGVLPGMHRFALRFLEARRALEQGDETGYVRLLRAGLEAAPVMKGMVRFLTRELEQRAQTQASPELLALAEKVREILDAYPQDDPAVLALKQSEAYQRVAFLIEDPAPDAGR